MLAQPRRGTYEIIQTAYENPAVAYERLRKMTRTGIGVWSSMIELKTFTKPMMISKTATCQNSVTPY